MSMKGKKEPEPITIDTIEEISPWSREAILREAIALTTGDRNRTYGDPYKNLSTTGTLLHNLLEKDGNFGILAENYAMAATKAMIAAKLARIAVNPAHRDNYVDLAAYAAILGEVAAKAYRYE